MKRLIFGFLAVLTLAGIAYCESGDVFATAPLIDNSLVTQFRIGADGQIVQCSTINTTGDINLNYYSVIKSSIIGYGCAIDTWIDLPAKSTFSITGTQVGGAYMGQIILDTATLVSGTSTYLFGLGQAQPSSPRNIAVTLSLWAGKATSYFVLPVTVTGYDARNTAITDVVIASGTNTSVSKTTKAFSLITSLTFGQVGTSPYRPAVGYGTDEQLALIYIDVGTGDILGLMGDVNRKADIYKATQDYVDQALSEYTVDATNDTITPTDVPNASLDYKFYRYVISR